MEFIYCITFPKTGMKYVGRTSNPKKREYEHITALKNNRHPNKRMQIDFNKFPQEILFEIIAEVPCVRNKRNGTPEQFWMKKLKTYDEKYGYNDNDFSVLPMRSEAGLPCKKTNHFKQKSARCSTERIGRKG